MSQNPSTNSLDQQKAASPGAETEIQAEIRALKAKIAEMEAAAAAATAATSEVKLSAESAPKSVAEPASSSTPAALAINESGYYESGQYPPPDSKLHPPQQRERLQKSAPRPPQPKKPSTQGPAAKEREKKVKEQKELGNTERRASLGGYEVTSGAEGLAGSKHVPCKIAPRQPSQPRRQGRGKRGGGQAGRGAVVKKEEFETQGVQIRGASQRGRSDMRPPPTPPSHQTSIPVAPPPGQRPCHMPFCSGNLTVYTPVCPLCGTPRQECQGPSMHGAQPPPYQHWGSSALNPYASTPLAFYGSSPAPVAQPYSSYSQYPGQPPFNYPSWWASPPSPFSFPGYTAPSPARDSMTSAPPARGPSQGVKRERSPSNSLHGESQPPQLSKRALKKIRKAEFKSASTVPPSIETPQPQQLSQPSSVAEVPQQLLRRQSESSGDRPVEQPIKNEPDSRDEMEFAPASSDAAALLRDTFRPQVYRERGVEGLQYDNVDPHPIEQLHLHIESDLPEVLALTSNHWRHTGDSTPQQLSFRYECTDHRVVDAKYRWLGGIYFNASNQRYKVFWRGQEGHGNTPLLEYDSSTEQCMVELQAVSDNPNDMIPSDWWLEGALVFLERIYDRDQTRSKFLDLGVGRHELYDSNDAGRSTSSGNTAETGAARSTFPVDEVEVASRTRPRDEDADMRQPEEAITLEFGGTIVVASQPSAASPKRAVSLIPQGAKDVATAVDTLDIGSTVMVASPLTNSASISAERADLGSLQCEPTRFWRDNPAFPIVRRTCQRSQTAKTSIAGEELATAVDVDENPFLAANKPRAPPREKEFGAHNTYSEPSSPPSGRHSVDVPNPVDYGGLACIQRYRARHGLGQDDLPTNVDPSDLIPISSQKRGAGSTSDPNDWHAGQPLIFREADS